MPLKHNHRGRALDLKELVIEDKGKRGVGHKEDGEEGDDELPREQVLGHARLLHHVRVDRGVIRRVPVLQGPVGKLGQVDLNTHRRRIKGGEKGGGGGGAIDDNNRVTDFT